MDKQEIKVLLAKYEACQCTPEEKALLEHWYFTQQAVLPPPDEIQADLDTVWRNIQPQPAVRRLWPRIAAAASILLVLGLGGYFIWHKDQAAPAVAVVKHDFLPGTNSATLTLANGKQIVLTKTMSGQLAVQGQTKIQMNNGGTVTYTGSTSETIYNTLTTKRKQQFPLVLADGTEVMLDAESSITYPVTFNGNERKVKITGQAYFKVVHNDKQPFAVEVKGQTIRDIGTEFNINAYDDEPVIKTTLVEGSIAVNYKEAKKILKPGDEAVLDHEKLIVQPGNIEEATAWKNNLFQFGGSDVKEVMRQFARWYDVDISYEGEMPDDVFGGKISRAVKASEVFDALKSYHLNFKIEGRKVIVSKK